MPVSINADYLNNQIGDSVEEYKAPKIRNLPYYKGFETVTVDDFDIREIFLNQLEISKVKSGSVLIQYLEMYDLVSIDQLVEVMDKYKPKDFDCSVGYVTKIEDFRNLPEEIFEICRMNDILVESYSETEITLVIDMFSVKELNQIDLSLSKYRVKIKFVTTVNFNKLVLGKNRYPDVLFFLKRVIIDCIDKNVTDVHFDTYYDRDGTPRWRVGYRIGLKLINQYFPDLEDEDLNKMINSLIGQKTNSLAGDIEETGVTALASDFLKDGKVNLRASVDKLFYGYDLVIRIQNLKTVSKMIEELGFEDREVGILKNNAKRRTGLTLITGPIRTGKNTTAFAIINEMIKTQDWKIKDLSSPIESLIPIPQVDYHGNVESLLNHLEIFVKQDINVVNLNEIPSRRVAEGVRRAVNASIHVVTTFHVDRLWDFPTKMEELFGDNYKSLIDKLNIVCNQKMFEKICPYCSKKFAFENLEDKELENIGKGLNINYHYVEQGCEHCKDIYSTQIQPCVEILEITEDIKYRLKRMSSSYEMVEYLKHIMKSNKFNMEMQVSRYISSGVIGYKALEQFR